MKTFFLGLNVFGTVVFAGFALLQINDTDPSKYVNPSRLDAWTWVLFYGIIATLFLLGFWRKFPLLTIIGALIFCLVQMIVTGPGVYDNLFRQDEFALTGAQMAPDKPHVELSREFFGALIGAAALALIAWQRRWWRRQQRPKAELI